MALLEERCEKCGRILQGNSDSAEPLICSGCGNSISRAAAFGLGQPSRNLRAMPRVVVPGGGRAATVAIARTGVSASAAIDQDEPEPSPLHVAFAEAFPWAVSVAFHLGAFLILSFFSTFVPLADKGGKAKPIDAPLPQSEMRAADPHPKKPPTHLPGTSKSPGSTVKTANQTIEEYNPNGNPLDLSKFVGGSLSDSDRTGTGPENPYVVGTRVPTPGDGTFGKNGGGTGPGKGPIDTIGGNPLRRGSRLFGDGNLPDGVLKIVFVVDNSGSMNLGGAFDFVKVHLKRTIGELSLRQEFQVIMFADNVRPDGALKINGQTKLFHPTGDNAKAAYKWIDAQVASSDTGVTDPTEAIKLAFKAGPELIFLVTDGEFSNAPGGNEGVKKLVSSLNKDKSVMINTIWIMDRKTDATPAVLKDISHDNGGICTGVYKADLGKY